MRSEWRPDEPVQSDAARENIQDARKNLIRFIAPSGETLLEENIFQGCDVCMHCVINEPAHPNERIPFWRLLTLTAHDTPTFDEKSRGSWTSV